MSKQRHPLVVELKSGGDDLRNWIPSTRMTNKLPVGTNYCQCGGCGAYFASDHSFALHRVGPARDRACLSTEALVRKGFSLVETKHGAYWALGRSK